MTKHTLYNKYYQEYKKLVFPTNREAWDQSTPEQREEWKQAAIEQDKVVSALKRKIADQHRELIKRVRNVYGDTQTGDYVVNYLERRDRHPLYNGYYNSNLNEWKKHNKDREQRIEEQRIKEQRQQQAERQQQQKQQRHIMLGQIVERYDIDTSEGFDIYDIIDKLLDKDKYLRLAIAGEETRNNWSEGFYRVKHALQQFKPSEPIDYQIVEQYESALSGGERDGRVFRDMTFNYNELYDMVEDEQLVEDVSNLIDIL